MSKEQYTNKLSAARLAWACRRGMLELDILLGNFLKEAYPNLTATDQDLFVQLLECSDPELFAWLLGQEKPSDPDLLRIVDKIRQHANSRI